MNIKITVAERSKISVTNHMNFWQIHEIKNLRESIWIQWIY